MVRVIEDVKRAYLGFNRLYFPNMWVKHPGGTPTYIRQAERRKSDGHIWIVVGDMPGVWQRLSSFVESSAEENSDVNYCHCINPDCPWCNQSI